MDVLRTNLGFYPTSLCKTHTAMPVKIVPGKEAVRLVEEQRIGGGE